MSYNNVLLASNRIVALLEIIIDNELDVNVNIIQSSFDGSGRDDVRTLTVI